MVVKTSKTTVRKVDKPKTALNKLNKEYDRVTYTYNRVKGDHNGFTDLEASGLDAKRRKIAKKQEAVKKVVQGNAKANNAQIGSSLGRVNGSMKKSDAKGTYKQAQRDLNALQESAYKARGDFYRSSGVGYGQYKAMKSADKDVKRQEKNVVSLSKYNKGTRVQKRK